MSIFEYKVGDLVYCHTSFIFNNKIFNKKGKTYSIEKIDTYDTYGIQVTTITLEHEEGVDFKVLYFLTDNNIHKNIRFYREYFLTPTQYRKLKLNNINDKN